MKAVAEVTSTKVHIIIISIEFWESFLRLCRLCIKNGVMVHNPFDNFRSINKTLSIDINEVVDFI